MNKFLTVFALCALAACCSADEKRDAEMEKEVGLLLGHEKLFADYCFDERIKIISDIKSRTAESSSAVFNIFFGAATEIADEVMNVERQAVEEFAKQIEAPAEKVDDAPLPEDKIQALIEEGKREIQAKQNVFGRVVAAAKSAAGPVLYNAANSALFVRLAKGRSLLNAQTLLKGIIQTCSQVAEYETRLETDLVQAKEQLKEAHPEEEVQKFIDSVKLPALKCYTTKYISRLNAFCELFKNGASPFMKMLGLGSEFKLPQ